MYRRTLNIDADAPDARNCYNSHTHVKARVNEQQQRQAPLLRSHAIPGSQIGAFLNGANRSALDAHCGTTGQEYGMNAGLQGNGKNNLE